MISVKSQCSRFSAQDPEVDIRDLTIYVDDRVLLDGAHLHLKPGVRYGLLGRNGVGKSVLMRSLADGKMLDENLRENLRILFVHQSLETGNPGSREKVYNDDFDNIEGHKGPNTDNSSKKKLKGPKAAREKRMKSVSGKTKKKPPSKSSELPESPNQSGSQSIEDPRSKLTILQEINIPPFGVDFKLTELEKLYLRAEHRSGARGWDARVELLKYQRRMQESKDNIDESESIEEQLSDSIENSLKIEENPYSLDPATVKNVLKQMKFPDDCLNMPMEHLSGGWKMRVHIAKAVLYEPDILLLDEPTNHLDIAGVVWLQKYLVSDKFPEKTAVLLVSHNRSFLNYVTEQVIWFKNKNLEYFKGNYDQFLQTISEKALFAEKMGANIEKKKAQMEASIRQTYQQAKKQSDDKKLKQVASKKAKLENRVGFERSAKGHRFKLNRDRVGFFHSLLGDVEGVDEERTQARLRFSIPDAQLPRSGGPLIVMDQVYFSRPGRGLNNSLIEKSSSSGSFQLHDLNLSVEPGDRVAILGPNGEGKTTILNLLSGKIRPNKGSVSLKTSKLGIFEQDMVLILGKDTRNPIERMKDQYPDENIENLRKHLGSFGLGSSQFASNSKLKNLSGGQRVAYAFAEISYGSPSLLLLDEPNSHLDLDALEALENSLANYNGAIVFVSHDISFVLDVSTHCYWVSEGRLEDVPLDQVEKRAYKTKTKKGSNSKK